MLLETSPFTRIVCVSPEADCRRQGPRNPVGKQRDGTLYAPRVESLGFCSENVDATIAELARREAPAFLPPTDFPEGDTVRVALVQDSEGNVIQFVGPGRKVTKETKNYQAIPTSALFLKSVRNDAHPARAH
jgi:hypothetical protein